MVASDRRTVTRFRPALSTFCRCLTGGEGLVWDLSATGLGMLTPRPLAAGEVVQAELTNGCASLFVAAQVAHARPLESGYCFVGLWFYRPLARHELAPFVGNA